MSQKVEDLINKHNFTDPIKDISGFESQELKSLLDSMLMIRLCEEKLAKEKEKGNIIGPVHLGAGQEAIASGVAFNLRKSDRIFGAHRSHSHILSLETNLRSFFAEILGRKTGLSKGMGGSMHLWDKSNGFYGSVPIVAGTVPIALGAGLAAKFDGLGDIAIAYMGDSAVEEGVVHESLNLASLLKIPIIFVVENNMFGSHMHISQRQPLYSAARFAVANGIESRVIDGNNIIEVINTSKELINNARNKNQPGFIEAFTYRWYGHVDWREDIDVGVNRSKEDLLSWKERDPIKRLKESMINKDIIDLNDFKVSQELIFDQIEKSWNLAIEDPYPEASKLIEHVYRSNK